LVSVHNPKKVLSRFKSEREKNTLIFKELLLIHLFISEYCFLTRDLKIENFLLDEHNNIKIVGECVLPLASFTCVYMYTIYFNLIF